MEKWYFTFGVGCLMRGYIICIEGTFEEARAKMVAQFGTKWCGQYDEVKAKELIKEYNYKVIDV